LTEVNGNEKAQSIFKQLLSTATKSKIVIRK